MLPITRGQKIFFAVICLAALLVAVLGLFNPAYLASIFTWMELPPLHARFVGTIYLFGAVFMGECLLVRYQGKVRWAVQMIGIWTGMLFIISLLNLGAFDFTLLPVQIWFASYIVYPIISIWLTLRQPRLNQAGELPGPVLSGWARGFLVLQGILVTLLAVFLFSAPVSMSNLWPWRVSPALAQMYSGPLLSYGIGSILYSRQNKWMGVRALVPAMLAFSAITIVISLLHINLFSFNQIPDLLWFGWFILATLVLAIMTVRALQVRG